MTNIQRSLFLLFILSACSSDTKEENNQTGASYIADKISAAESQLSIPNNQVVDHYKILLMGNSHINNLASMIEPLIKARFPLKEVTISNAPGNDYLAERIDNKSSVELLINSPWTHVILQAQKYSTTGQYSYPIDAAIAWINLSKNQNTTPIMFPEHPRFGNINEGLQVHLLHQEIATIEPACVAPIGLAWDRAIALYPSISLHSGDDNHANSTGRLLSALVFYQVITGESADALPYVDTIDIDEVLQNQLGEVASYAIEANPACDY